MLRNGESIEQFSGTNQVPLGKVIFPVASFGWLITNKAQEEGIAADNVGLKNISVICIEREAPIYHFKVLG